MRKFLPFAIEIERTKSGWNFTQRFCDGLTAMTPWRFGWKMRNPCLLKAGDVLRNTE